MNNYFNISLLLLLFNLVHIHKLVRTQASFPQLISPSIEKLGECLRELVWPELFLNNI